MPAHVDSPFSSIDGIPLDNLPSPDNLSHKFSFGAAAPTLDHKEQLEQERQQTPYRPPARFTMDWARAEDVLWATVPLVFMLVGFGLVTSALFQQSIPYLSVIETDGTGRMDYSVLGASLPLPRSCSPLTHRTGACGIAPNTTLRICQPRALNVDFTPSLTLIAPGVPGFAILKLPFASSQTPAVFLAAFIAHLLSLVLFLPAWTLAYFPSFPFPTPLTTLIRDHARRFYQAAGVLAFTAMILTITVGMGYKLLLLAATNQFNLWIQQAFFAGLVVPGTTNWYAETGGAYDLVWAAVVMQAFTALGANVALHNGLDERIEKGTDGDERSASYW